jgi:hypothetical protein
MLSDVIAPGPVEPGDLVASADEVYRIDAVLWTPQGTPCIPALARRIDLNVSARSR